MIQRCEYKYLIDEATAARVRDMLAGRCESDRHAVATRGRYLCDTLYLDTFDRRCYRATIENSPRRYKLRVRRYAAGDRVFLEVKRRVDDTIVKTRAVLGGDWIELLHDDRGLTTVALAVRPALENFLSYYRASYGGPMLPTVLVRYEREPYTSLIDPYVRVTMDRKIESQRKVQLSLEPEQRCWRSIDDPISLRTGASSSTTILELKFNDPAPRWLCNLARALELPRLSFCKYTRAVDSMLARPSRLESPFSTD